MAHQIANGHFLADAHNQGEVRWYPFVTPLVAGLTARLTGWPVFQAYYGADMILRGVFLAGAAPADVGSRR